MADGARHSRPGIAALALAAGLLAWDDAVALRCGTELVTEGDYAYRVRQACGEPDAVDALDAADGPGYGPAEETWYYDFGADRFVRVLHFRDGRLRRIETSARSPDGDDGGGDGDCRPAEIGVGMSSYGLLQACGDPVQREHRYVRRHPYPASHPQLVEDVLVEEWIYDFGPNRFARRVRLEDGEVVEVTTLH